MRELDPDQLIEEGLSLLNGNLKGTTRRSLNESILDATLISPKKKKTPDDESIEFIPEFDPDE